MFLHKMLNVAWVIVDRTFLISIKYLFHIQRMLNLPLSIVVTIHRTKNVDIHHSEIYQKKALSFVVHFSSFSLAESTPRDLQITAYK